MDQIVVSRHGVSVAVAGGVANGVPEKDAGLTAAGEDSARALGREIVHDPIELCITSRFPRTQQTAALALADRQVVLLVDANLDDLRYGEFEGQPKERYRAWTETHDFATAPPGGESRLHVAARLCAALDDVTRRPETCALVVTHELLIADLLNAVEGRPPDRTHADIPCATPYRFTSIEMRRGGAFLREWLVDHGVTVPGSAAG